MFTSFYHLKCRPFENTPDPDFLYLSKQHREVLYSLIYGIESAKGFILLAGDVGTGKTTLVRALLKEIGHRHKVIAIANPRVEFNDILAYLCRKLDLEDMDRFDLTGLELLSAKLVSIYGDGQKRLVLLIDEAHLLTEETLEGIRLLSNLESNQSKLIQIVLVGQNEIYTLLERESQRSLKQRIVINRQLRPLTRKDTVSYISHRLTEAGRREELFDRRAVAMIWRSSGGTPRVINQICDNALLIGYALKTQVIGPKIIQEVLDDMGPMRPKAGVPFFFLPLAVRSRWSFAAGAILLILGLGVSSINSLSKKDNLPPPLAALTALPMLSPEAALSSRSEQQDICMEGPVPSAPMSTSPSVTEALPSPPVKVSVPKLIPPPIASIVVEPVVPEEEVVQHNGSLTALAIKRYGVATETVLDLIQSANGGIVDINLLQPGQSLVFPVITRESMVILGDDGKFHIHYASFYAKGNARRVQEKFVREGKESFFSLCRQGESQVFRVYVGSFARHEEAVELLKTIEFKNLPFLNKGKG